jgi:hypothetical protein
LKKSRSRNSKRKQTCWRFLGSKQASLSNLANLLEDQGDLGIIPIMLIHDGILLEETNPEGSAQRYLPVGARRVGQGDKTTASHLDRQSIPENGPR